MKNRSNIAASILQNPEILEAVREASANDYINSAEDELNKYLDSIEGRITQFKNRLQELASVSISTEWLKDIINLGTKGLEVITALGKQFGTLNVAIGAAVGIFAQKQGLGLASFDKKTGQYSFGITKLVSNMKDAFINAGRRQNFGNEVLDSFFAGADRRTNLNQYIKEREKEFVAITPQIPKSFIDGVTGLDEATTTVGDAIDATTGKVWTFKNALGSLKSFGVAALSSLATAGLTMLAAFAVEKIIEGVHNWIHAEEIAIEKAKDAQETIKGINDELSNAKDFNTNKSDRLIELNKGVDKNTGKNITLTNDEYEEYLQLANEIANIYPSVVESYDSQGNAILNLSHNTKEATEQIKEFLDTEKLVAGQKIENELGDVLNGKLLEIKNLRGDINEAIEKRDEYNRLAESAISEESIRKLFSYEGTTVNKAQYAQISSILEEMYPGFVFSRDVSDGYSIKIDFEVTNENELDQKVAEIKQNLLSSDVAVGAGENLVKAMIEQGKIATAEAKKKSIWADAARSITDSFMEVPKFNEFSEEFQDQIYHTIASIDPEELPDINPDKWGEYFQNTYLTPIINAAESFSDNKAFERVFSRMLSPDFDKNLTAEELKTKVDQTLESLFPDQGAYQVAVKVAMRFVDDNGNWEIDDQMQRILNALEFPEEGLIKLPFNKDDLKNLTGEYRDLFIKALDSREFSFSILNEDNTYSTWEDLLAYLDKFREKEEEIAKNGTLGQIFQDPTYQNDIEGYEKKLSSLTGALQTIRDEGSLTADAMKTLQESFPALTDFSFESISNEAEKQLGGWARRISSEWKDMSPAGLKQMQTYIDNLVMSYGKLDVSAKEAENAIRSSIANSDTAKNIAQSSAAGALPQYIDQQAEQALGQLKEAYGDDINWEIVWMLALEDRFSDPAANILEEYDKKILEWKVIIDTEDKVKEIGKRREIRASNISALEAQINNQKATNNEVDEELYNQLLAYDVAEVADARETWQARKKAYEDVSKDYLTNTDTKYTWDQVEQLLKDANEAEVDYLDKLNAQRENKKAQVENGAAKWTNILDTEKTISDKLNNTITNATKNGDFASEAVYQRLAENFEQQQNTNLELQKYYEEQANEARNDGDFALYNNFMQTAKSFYDAAIEAEQNAQQALRQPYEDRLTQLTNDLNVIQSESQKITDEISVNQAKGLKANEKQYKSLAKYTKDNVSNLKNQNQVLEAQLKIEKNTTKQKELQQQIASNKSTISGLEVQAIDYDKQANSLIVNQAKELSSAISTALSETASSTGMAEESIDALITGFSNLGDKADISKVFYNTADGVKVNVVALQELAQKQNEVINAQFAAKIAAEQARLNEAAKGTDAYKQATETIRELMEQQSQYFAQYEEQMKKFNEHGMIELADATANPGEGYDKAANYYKQAKEWYDKGLVGTDDFKARAAYFDDNGFGDWQTFKENMDKFGKYFTEDPYNGIMAFISDLESKGLVTIEKMADGSQKASSNFKTIAEAAEKMGMSEIFFSDLLSKSEEYGATNVWVSSMEEAEQKLQDYSAELEQAQNKYAEMIKAGADTSALEKQKGVIDEIKGKLGELDSATTQFNESVAESYTDGFARMQDTIDKLKEAHDAGLISDDVFAKSIDELQDKYHVDIDTNLKINEQQYNEQLKELGSAAQKALLDAEEEATRTRQERMRTYQEARELGVDRNQTTFGNIDLANRQTITWDDSAYQANKAALDSLGESWEELDGTISTVMGRWETYQGVPIAFSPMLQGEDGASPTILSQESIDQYLNAVIAKAGGDTSLSNILKIDSEGIEVNGQVIKGIIADIGETAEETAKKMHFVGPDGALSTIDKDLLSSEQYTNFFERVAEEADKSGSAVAKMVDTLSSADPEIFDKITFGDGKYTEGYEAIEAALDGLLADFGLGQERGEDLLNILQAIIEKSKEQAAAAEEGPSLAEKIFGDLSAMQDFINNINVGQIGLNNQKLINNMAQELAELASSQEGQEILLEYGFVPADGKQITAEDIKQQIGTIELDTTLDKQEEENKITINAELLGLDDFKEFQTILDDVQTKAGDFSKLFNFEVDSEKISEVEKIPEILTQIGEAGDPEINIIVKQNQMAEANKAREKLMQNGVSEVHITVIDDQQSLANYQSKITSQDFTNPKSTVMISIAPESEKQAIEDFVTNYAKEQNPCVVKISLGDTGSVLTDTETKLNNLTSEAYPVTITLSDVTNVDSVLSGIKGTFSSAQIPVSIKAGNKLSDITADTVSVEVKPKGKLTNIESEVVLVETKQKEKMTDIEADAVYVETKQKEKITNIETEDAEVKMVAGNKIKPELEENPVKVGIEYYNVGSEPTLEYSANMVLENVPEDDSSELNKKGTITYTGNIELALAAADAAVAYAESQEPVMKIDGDNTAALAEAASARVVIANSPATMPINAETGNLVGQIHNALATNAFSVNVQLNALGTLHVPVTKESSSSTSQSGLYVPGNRGIPGKTYTGTMFGVAHADGTAYNVANLIKVGSANAKGDVTIDENQESLVNELGTESIIRDGKWFLIPGGMHVEHLKRGDIVLNHLQTADLMRDGQALGRGKMVGSARAFAQGSVAYNGMPAHGWAMGPNPNPVTAKSGFTSNSSSSSSTDNQIEEAADKLNDAADNISESSEEEKSALDGFKEWLGKLFDWVEIKLDKMQKRVDNTVEKAEQAFDNKQYVEAIKLYNDALSESADLLNVQTQAVTKYEQKADEVMRKALETGAISEAQAQEIRIKIDNGSMDIEEYDDDLREIISSYQTWAEKVDNAKDRVKDLNNTLKEHVEKIKEVAKAQVEDIRESAEETRGKAESKADLYSSIGGKTYAYTAGAKYSQARAAERGASDTTTAYYDAAKAINSGVATARGGAINAIKANKDTNEAYNKLLLEARTNLNNGRKVSEDVIKKISERNPSLGAQLEAFNLAMDNAETAQLEYLTRVAEETALRNQNISDKYANIDSKIQDEISDLEKQNQKDLTASQKNHNLDRIVYRQNKLAENATAKATEYGKNQQTYRAEIRTMKADEVKGANYSGLIPKAKQNVNAACQQAKDAAKSGKLIDASLLTKLAQYASTGLISGEFFTACFNYNDAVERRIEAEDAAEIAQETAKQSASDVAKQKIANVQAEYDQKRENVAISQGAAKRNIAARKAQGYDVEEEDIKQQLSEQKEYYRINKDEATYLRKQLKTMDKDSDIYRETAKKLNEVEEAANDAGVKIVELNNQMANMKFAAIDKAIEKLEDSNDKLESILQRNDAKGNYTDASKLRNLRDNAEDEKNFWAEKARGYEANVNLANKNGGVWGGKTADAWRKEANTARVNQNQSETSQLNYEKQIRELPLEKWNDFMDILKADLNKAKNLEEKRKNLVDQQKNQAKIVAKYNALANDENIGEKQRMEYKKLGKSAEEDLNAITKQLNELPMQKFDMLMEGIDADLDEINNTIDLTELKDELVSASVLEDKRAKLIEKTNTHTARIAELENLLKNPDLSLEERREYNNQLTQEKNALASTTKELVQTNQSIGNLDITKLNDAIEAWQRFVSIIESTMNRTKAEGNYVTREQMVDNIRGLEGQYKYQEGLVDKYTRNYNEALETGESEGFSADHWKEALDNAIIGLNNLGASLANANTELAQFDAGVEESNDKVKDEHQINKDELATAEAEMQTRIKAGMEILPEEFDNVIGLATQVLIDAEEDVEKYRKLKEEAEANGQEALAASYEQKEEEAQQTVETSKQKIIDLQDQKFQNEIDGILRVTKEYENEYDKLVAKLQAKYDNWMEEASEEEIKAATDLQEKIGEGYQKAETRTLQEADKQQAAGNTVKASDLRNQASGYGRSYYGTQSTIRSIQSTRSKSSDSSKEDEDTLADKLQRELNILDAEYNILKAKQDLIQEQGKALDPDDYQARIDSLQAKIRKSEELIKANNDLAAANKGDDKKLKEYQKAAKDAEAQTYQLKQEIEQLTETMLNIPAERMQRVLDILESQYKVLEAHTNLLSAQGKDISISRYEEQIDAIREQIKQNKELIRINMELANSYGPGNKKGEEYLKKAQQIEAQTYSLEQQVESLGDALRNAWNIKPLEDYLQRLNIVKGAFETIAGIIPDDMMYDEAGNLTDLGITSLAMTIKSYETSNEQLAILLQERQRILKEYNNGLNEFYSQAEFEKDFSDITSKIQQQYSSTIQLMLKVSDMVTRNEQEAAQGRINAMQKEADEINEIIEKRKKLLQEQQEYYSFDKTLRDKTNDLALLEKQRKALEGLTDKESRAKLQKINKQIKESRQDLEDTIRDHNIELQITGLDDLQQAINKKIDKAIEKMNEASKKTTKNIDSIINAVKDATKTVEEGMDTVDSTIEKLLNVLGIPGLTAESIGLTDYLKTLFSTVIQESQEETPSQIVLPDGTVLMPSSALGNGSNDFGSYQGLHDSIQEAGAKFGAAVPQQNNIVYPNMNENNTVNVGGITNNYTINDATDPDAVVRAIDARSKAVSNIIGEQFTKKVKGVGIKKTWG